MNLISYMIHVWIWVDWKAGSSRMSVWKPVDIYKKQPRDHLSTTPTYVNLCKARGRMFEPLVSQQIAGSQTVFCLLQMRVNDVYSDDWSAVTAASALSRYNTLYSKAYSLNKCTHTTHRDTLLAEYCMSKYVHTQTRVLLQVFRTSTAVKTLNLSFSLSWMCMEFTDSRAAEPGLYCQCDWGHVRQMSTMHWRKAKWEFLCLRPPVNKPTEDYKADQRGVLKDAANEELRGRRKRRTSARRIWAEGKITRKILKGERKRRRHSGEGHREKRIWVFAMCACECEVASTRSKRAREGFDSERERGGGKKRERNIKTSVTSKQQKEGTTEEKN